MSTTEGLINGSMSPQAAVDTRQSLPRPTIFDKETIQSLPRQYIITELRKKGYQDIAEKLPPVKNPEDAIHEVLGRIADTLSEEREEQFREMLTTLALDSSNLKELYDSIMSEMFEGNTHWGKIVTFIVFSSHLTLYCAEQEDLRHRVCDVVAWTDEVMRERLHCWIEQQGGWQAFVEHFDLENWRVSLSTALLTVGLGMSAAVLGGLFIFKKLHLL